MVASDRRRVSCGPTVAIPVQRDAAYVDITTSSMMKPLCVAICFCACMSVASALTYVPMPPKSPWLFSARTAAVCMKSPGIAKNDADPSMADVSTLEAPVTNAPVTL